MTPIKWTERDVIKAFEDAMFPAQTTQVQDGISRLIELARQQKVQIPITEQPSGPTTQLPA